MDVRELKKKMRQLPTIPMGTVANDRQIVEGDENGCRYKITKETPWRTEFLYYSLSVSGPREKQIELIERFESFMGKPLLAPCQFAELPGITF
ncbi:MAG: hypothetical protein Q8P08_02025, partial [bacterium]|nr:hypothetical protein [bacterium]